MCAHDNVHVTFHILPPPSPYIFSLPSAFGYSSNRIPLSQTANNDNGKDYNNDNNCNIPLGFLVMWTARASTLFLLLRGYSLVSVLYMFIHCSTRWGCFFADTGLIEH